MAAVSETSRSKLDCGGRVWQILRGWRWRMLRLIFDTAAVLPDGFNRARNYV
jgi:hypothetical protein